jgi:hypothetical protein
MTLEAEPVRDHERSAALDGWVAAFDREMESSDFAASVAAMTAHGCFDVRAVAERWILANPTADAPPAHVQPRLPEPVALRLVPAEVLVPGEALVPTEALVLDEEPALEEAVVPAEPAVAAAPASRTPGAASSPDIAYFRSLLQGGIERAQIDEAFPGFRLVIDEAVAHHEAAEEPILSDVPPPPSREDLNDEIRGMRQKLQESAKRGRRRWRARD